MSPKLLIAGHLS